MQWIGTLLLVHSVSCNLLRIIDYKVVCHIDFVECNIVFTNNTSEWFFNVEYNVTKTVTGNIMSLVKFFRMMGAKKTRFAPLPKFNYCSMRSGLAQFPIVSQLFLQMTEHGNAVPKCPIKPGHYKMEQFAIDSTPIAGFFPSGVYHGSYQAFNENRKPIIELVKFEFSIEKL